MMFFLLLLLHFPDYPLFTLHFRVYTRYAFLVNIGNWSYTKFKTPHTGIDFERSLNTMIAMLSSNFIKYYHVLYLYTLPRSKLVFDNLLNPSVLYGVYVFRADRKNKMAALASDWLIHFRLLRNHRTEFNET